MIFCYITYLLSMVVVLHFHGDKVNTQPTNVAKIDWHDYKTLYEDKLRMGKGEHGKPSYPDIESPQDYETQRVLSEVYGFNAFLSNQIAINRSIDDVRPEECKSKKYYSNLPTTAVVLALRNVHNITLMRTITSILKRTPHELLTEIILINDKGRQVDNEVGRMDKVKVIDVPVELGLVKARNLGAFETYADIIIFLDPYTEVTHNWLPPLIEPILLNITTVTVPVVDEIDNNTLYYNAKNNGVIGIFDRNLNLLLRSKPSTSDSSCNFDTPIMTTNIFAINRQWFIKLGAEYNDKINFSLKVWLTGGKITIVPCARVGIIKLPIIKEKSMPVSAWVNNHSKADFLKILNNSDLEVKNILNSRPYSQFLHNVAPDIEKILLHSQEFYEVGKVKPQTYQQYCLSFNVMFKRIEFLTCNNKTNQILYISSDNKISSLIDSRDYCMHTPRIFSVSIIECTEKRDGFVWRYNVDTKTLAYNETCLKFDIKSKRALTKKCNLTEVSEDVMFVIIH